MLSNQLKIVLFLLLSFVWTTQIMAAQVQQIDSHEIVAMRLIGHEILLSSGDSTSRIEPIKTEGNHYVIAFTSVFQFSPDAMVSIIENVVLKSNLSDHYIVEFVDCETRDIVYSFEMNSNQDSSLVPCSSRAVPVGCYEIHFEIIEESPQETVSGDKISANKQGFNLKRGILIVLASILLFGWWFFTFRRKKKSAVNSKLIVLGKFQFDQINMELFIERQRIELTSKESDLLTILYESVNETVEREELLNKVWGDEGDYVGRTLDVFISKLRKKLEADDRVKITNVRGVGYKLILNV